jgi:hypothetical protein
MSPPSEAENVNAAIVDQVGVAGPLPMVTTGGETLTQVPPLLPVSQPCPAVQQVLTCVAAPLGTLVQTVVAAGHPH